MDELDKYYDISLNDSDFKEACNSNLEHSKKITSNYELDNVEKTICWIAGLVAGAMDAFLLKAPKSGGYLNEKADNYIKNIFTSDEISKLERANWVPYDAANSANLDTKISGLYTKSHRFQSLGHDPILGFFYGVRDILTNSFTCYNLNGELINQSISRQSGITNIFEAIIRQIGHLKSDISTPAGLPIPFMSLLQSIQVGNINGKTIGEVSRLMYVKGYNLNHLAAMSIPAITIELLVRSFYMIYNLSNKKSIKESLPFSKPKVDKMLFNAYLISVGCNSFKIASQNGNLFAINPTLWAGTLKYGYAEFKRFINNEKERERHKYVMDIYKKREEELDKSIEENCRFYI